jgi:hypothetical protein
MPWVAAVGAVIGAGATIYSSDQQSSAASDAAATQAAGNSAAIAEQRRQFDTTQANYKPWLDSAMRFLPQYEAEFNKQPSAQDVMNQPGYQFGLSEGQKAVDRRVSAAGGRVSGAAIKAANRFATDYATSGYQAEFNRSEQRKNRLAQLGGFAPITAAANAGQSSTNAISGLLSSGADNAASAQLARGNIYGNAANQIGAYAQRGFGGSGGSNSGGSSYQNIAQSGSQGYIDPINYGSNYG